MKTIGILGGMHWRDTLEYYTNINTEVVNSVGIQHSARICIQNIDYEYLSNIVENNNKNGILLVTNVTSSIIESNIVHFL